MKGKNLQDTAALALAVAVGLVAGMPVSVLLAFAVTGKWEAWVAWRVGAGAAALALLAAVFAITGGLLEARSLARQPLESMPDETGPTMPVLTAGPRTARRSR